MFHFDSVPLDLSVKKESVVSTCAEAATVDSGRASSPDSTTADLRVDEDESMAQSPPPSHSEATPSASESRSTPDEIQQNQDVAPEDLRNHQDSAYINSILKSDAKTQKRQQLINLTTQMFRHEIDEQLEGKPAAYKELANRHAEMLTNILNMHIQNFLGIQMKVLCEQIHGLTMHEIARTSILEASTNHFAAAGSPVVPPSAAVVAQLPLLLQQHFSDEQQSSSSGPTDQSISPPQRQSQTPKERNFKCYYDGCDKSYTKQSHLKTHLDVHSGERPYVCPFDGCNWRFTRQDGLNRHVRKHTGDRPYSCATCGKTFARSDHLNLHLRRHVELSTFLVPHQ